MGNGAGTGTTTVGTNESLSFLACQLSDAASNAKIRDASQDHASLNARLTTIAEQIIGDSYKAHKATYDAEIPNTANQELLERAKQATAFVNGQTSNPFEGLPPSQLALIVFDESGTFTVNERRAAWLEADAWKKSVSEESVPPSLSASEESDTGYDLMISRLFRGKEPDVADGTHGMSIDNISKRPVLFLTKQDRTLLAKMYAYAKEQGADLNHVDSLANRLGSYRQHNNGKSLNNFNNGHMYDTQGRQLTVSFTEKDAATASRILNGTAIQSTSVDRGFLRHILDPGYGALCNSVDLEFLEQMVTKFSAEGSEQSTLDGKFSSRRPIDKAILHASEDVRLPAFESDFTNKDGRWAVTEKGRARGFSLENLFDAAPQRRRAFSNIMHRNILYAGSAFSAHGRHDEFHQPWLERLLVQLGLK